jgi:DNA mismatch repair protein MSH6
MSPKKQGTLFSFFAKKPSPAKKACASSSKTLASKLPVRPSSSTQKDHSKQSKFETNGSKKIKNKSKQEDLLRRVSVGSTLSIYWPDDKKYYNAKVTSMGNSGSAVTLLYDDGEVETVDLSGERFKVLSETTTEAAGSPTSEAQEPVPVTQESSKKKRRVIEDESEEEFEFEDDVEDGDSDASEFIADDVSEDEEDLDESVMITDEDEEKIIDLKTRKRVRVSEVKNPYEKPSKKVATVDAKRAKSASFVTPPPKKKANLSSNSFAAFASPRSLNKFQSPSQPRNLSTNDLTPLPSLKSPHKSQSQKAVGTRIPLPIEKTVNSAGTHYHNHFSFLLDENRRDAKNRLVSHPEYDRRTLRIDYEEIRKVTKNKITPASEQWWKIKSQYADTILLFKTGKFYEIFHMDADIAVQVLGFSYMKGTVAHAGFPEVGYGAFCEKLVRAGYKVARVEQTETPDMLKERKKRTSGKKPQVVNREVCSIVSAGTRTFCYMDDIKGLENEEFDGSIGPLLAIKEILVSDAKETEGDELKPACEFGVTIIDAARGTITLGQFADDMLYSRMNTLLTRFRPSEILVQSGGDGAASDTLHSLLKSIKGSLLPSCRVELIGNTLTFPKSTAIQSEIRAKIDRPSTQIKPWDVQETLTELHRKLYFPRSSRKTISPGDIAQGDGISRWPKTLQACIMGGANLALSSLGAALFYLQRSLIDEEILSMGIIKPYFPPEPTSLGDAKEMKDDSKLKGLAEEEDREESGVELNPHQNTPQFEFSSHEKDYQNLEKETNYMSLDGTTIANLEILSNIHSNTSVGSLWSKINFTKTPFGGRLLRAWLLRPLFKKADIDRRADAVEELMSGGAAAAMSEARAALAKCGDIERLLSRVHSMVGNGSLQERQHHPNERAVLYETAKHTKRKVEDFSRLLNGLRAASRIAEMFADVDIQSGMLQKIVKTTDNGGCLHPKITENLDWFFDNFDAHAASRGLFEPTKGIDENYDAAVDEVERIKQELDDYKDSICSELLKPSHVAKREWKYINTKADSKDKYLIELPVSVQVPGEFIVKGKR